MARQSGEDHHAWRENPSHDTQLHRVRHSRGRAKEHDCVSCIEDGKKVRADDWAHVHGESGNDPWSDFLPLCRYCHRRYDGTTNRGVNHHRARAKLSEAQVRRVRELIGDGRTNRYIAKKFNVNPSVVSKIRIGRIYVGIGLIEGAE